MKGKRRIRRKKGMSRIRRRKWDEEKMKRMRRISGRKDGGRVRG
jgi:hypothetical protein